MTEEELPSGWAMATLGDVCIGAEQVNPADVFPSEFRYLEISSIDNRHHKFVDPSLVDVAEAPSRARQLVRAGDTLFSTVRTNLKNIALVSQEYDGQICSTGFSVLRPKSNIEHRYIFYFAVSQAFVDRVSALQRGVSYPAVRDADVRAQAIPVAPLNEQRRIVERIDELFSQIEAGEAALARAKKLLERYRQSILKAAVTGELTRDWRERHPTTLGSDTLRQMIEVREQAAAAIGKPTKKRHHIPDENKFAVPDTWAWCSIEDAGDVQLGQQRAPQHHSGDHMRPYLRVANVLENKLDLSDVKTMNFMPGELPKFELKPGDILLNEGQSPDKLGRSAIYNGEIEGCCVQKTLLRFRAYPGVVPRFAQIVFRFYMNFERFKRIARITTNIGHLTRVRFVEMEFPVPPTEEQQLIADRFDALDTNVDSLMEAVPTSFSAALRQSILTAAFAGKLAPQDSTDEPAAALLDPIRAERITPSPSRRRRTLNEAKHMVAE